MAYDNNMTGVLFKNDKGGNPSRPDMRGTCEIDGKKFKLSAWTNESEKAGRYLKLKIQPDDAQ